MSARATWLSLACALAMSVWCASAAQAGPPETYARVVSERAALHSGPGAEFRVLGQARRSDRVRVIDRGPVGHWLELELDDGTRAFVRGDDLWLLDGEESATLAAQRSWLFAPPPLLRAHGELSVALGTLSGSGFFAVRPSYLLGPSLGIELSLGTSVGALGRLFLASMGGVVNLFPSWPVVPFVVAGGGGLRAAPNSDSFAFEQGTRSLAYGGGGLRFGFRQRLIVRIEGRGYALFDADRLTSQQEISGGLSAFF